jgi:hypothetical protein
VSHSHPRLQATPSFLSKLFQGSVVPMPSFSKQCLGGFVGFQGLIIDPNLFFIISKLSALHDARPEAKKTLLVCMKIFMI